MMKTRLGFTQRKTRRASAVLLAMCCLLACFGAGAYAQDAKIDLSHLDKLANKASQVTNVNLEGPMLKLAAENMAGKTLTAKGKAEQDMLQRLKGIYVRAYKFNKPGEYSRADLENVMKQLRSGGWTSIVNVEKKKEGAMTVVYVMNEGGETVGMAVVAAKPEELTIVNLVGPVDFAQLNNLDDIFDAAGLQRRNQPQNVVASRPHN